MKLKIRKLERHSWLLPVAVAVFVAAAPSLGLFGTFVHRELQLAAIYALVVVGFNMGFGLGGQLALGQVAVFAGGAYSTAILHDHGHSDLLLAVLVAFGFAAFLGLVVGLPGLRLSAWALALVAFFLVVLINNVTSLFSGLTGGVLGLPGISGPTVFGRELSSTAFHIATVTSAALVLLLYRNLFISRYSHALLVLSHGQALARSMGLSPYRLRLSAYVLCALPAGIAGVFYAYYATYVQAQIFNFGMVTLILAASIIGGVRSVWGAPAASALLVIVPDHVSAFEQYSVLAYGVMLVLIAIGFSSGIAGVGELLVAKVLRRPGAPSAPTAAEPAEPAEPVEPVEAHDEPEAMLQIAGATLVTTEVRKSFGGVEALRGVEFCARPAEVTAIIGANGAGKTTLLNAICGQISIDAGEVLLDGAPISGLQAERIARAGISRTFQTPQIPETFSVLDVAASSRISREWVPSIEIGLRSPRYRQLRSRDLAHAREALSFVGLEGVEHVPARALPLGQRRILEVARCIAAEPAVVLFDEPAAGLDPESLENLRTVLDKLRQGGATVVLIEHNVPFVVDIADAVFVMELGAVIASGTPNEIMANEAVIASYLGRRYSPALVSTVEPRLEVAP